MADKILTTVYLYREDVERAEEIAHEKRIRKTELYRNAVHQFFKGDDIDGVMVENTKLKNKIGEIKVELDKLRITSKSLDLIVFR